MLYEEKRRVDYRKSQDKLACQALGFSGAHVANEELLFGDMCSLG